LNNSNNHALQHAQLTKHSSQSHIRPAVQQNEAYPSSTNKNFFPVIAPTKRNAVPLQHAMDE
jgi:hypothetical protein